MKNQKKLYEALREIINEQGNELIADKRIIGFLLDYHAFNPKPTKRVLEAFLKMEYGKQMLELDIQKATVVDKENLINRISLRFIEEEGFQKKHVNYVLYSIKYGLGWCVDNPDKIAEEVLEEKEEYSYKRIFNIDDISFAMINVVGGSFNIGATPEQGIYACFDEKPSVQTKIDDFYLGETPVTQALWTTVMGDNPSHFKGENLPVERVSWEDCQVFIEKLNIQTGMNFRLPTEAEWEYAARGGQFSKQQKYAGANDDDKSNCFWFKENSQSQSHDVKSKLANELGLYDMSGNISEWCSDWYFNSYANNFEKKNPKGPASGVAKVYRGGSWDDKAINCRVSKRFSMSPKLKNKLIGLRLAATNI